MVPRARNHKTIRIALQLNTTTPITTAINVSMGDLMIWGDDTPIAIALRVTEIWLIANEIALLVLLGRAR